MLARLGVSVRFSIVLACTLFGSVQANAQDRQAEFRSLVQQMELVLPQSTQPVTRAKLAQIENVLNQLANVVREPAVPVQTAQTLVPQRRVVNEMVSVPVVGRFGRIIGSRPMMVQREVEVAVAATGQSLPTPQGQGVFPSPQSPVAAAPQAQAPPPTELTTIERNRQALLAAVLILRGQAGGAQDDKTEPAGSVIQPTAVSFRHIAIQTYALVISAQRLAVQDQPSPPDTQAGTVIPLNKP